MSSWSLFYKETLWHYINVVLIHFSSSSGIMMEMDGDHRCKNRWVVINLNSQVFNALIMFLSFFFLIDMINNSKPIWMLEIVCFIIKSIVKNIKIYTLPELKLSKNNLKKAMHWKFKKKIINNNVESKNNSWNTIMIDFTQIFTIHNLYPIIIAHNHIYTFNRVFYVITLISHPYGFICF